MCCGCGMRLVFFSPDPVMRGGLLALPLCGAAVTFFAAAKKVTKESSSLKPAVTRTLAMLVSRRWHSPKCRPRRTNRAWLAHGLTHRTSCAHWFSTKWLQPASRPMGQSGRRVLLSDVCHVTASIRVSLAYPTAARSAVPKLFRAEPARSNYWRGRPCAIQARLGLRGRHLGECHRRLASMANVRVTAGGERSCFLCLLSLQQQRK